MKRTLLLVLTLFLGTTTIFSQTQTPQETSPKQKISAKSLKEGQVQTVKTATNSAPTTSSSTSETNQEVPANQNGSNSSVIVPDAPIKDEQMTIVNK